MILAAYRTFYQAKGTPPVQKAKPASLWKTFCLFLIFLAGFGSYVFSQAGSVDSLNTQFRKALQNDPRSARQYAQQILTFSAQHNDGEGLGWGYLDLGILGVAECSYDTALFYYNRCLPYFNAVKHETVIAKAYMGKGTAHHFKGDHDNALGDYFKALKIYEKAGDNIMIVKALSNLGMVYEAQRQFGKALDVYERCQALNRLTGDSVNIADCHGNLGKVFFQLGNYTTAIRHHSTEAQIRQLIGDTLSLCYTYDNLSSAYAMAGQPEKGLQYQQEALKIYAGNGDKGGIANSYCNLGSIYSQLKNYPKALEYLHLGAKMAEEINSKLILNFCYEALVETYVKLNDYKNAFNWLEKSGVIKDSLYTTENSRQMATVEALYKTEKLTKEKLQAENQSMLLAQDRSRTLRQRDYSIAGAFLVLVLLSGVFYLYSLRRKRVEEKKRINAMLLSEERERTRIARELHDGLGQLLSTARINAASLEGAVEADDAPLLRNTLSLIDQSVTEVRAVSHNLMPQLLSEKGLVEALNELVRRINDTRGLKAELHCSGFAGIPDKNVEIALYRVIQEVLNNIIRHAAASQIILKLQYSQNNLNIFISDNGKGFDLSAIEKSEGIGWKNIQTRLSLINGNMNINSFAGKGTAISIDVVI